MAFTDYIQSYIGGLSGTLGWDINTLNFIVSETLDLYGVATEGQATDLFKAHSLLKYKAMERALVDVSADYNYSADGGNFQRSNVFNQIWKMLQNAIHDAMLYLPEGQIQVGSLDMGRNPYQRAQIGTTNGDLGRAVDEATRELHSTDNSQ